MLSNILLLFLFFFFFVILLLVLQQKTNFSLAVNTESKPEPKISQPALVAAHAHTHVHMHTAIWTHRWHGHIDSIYEIHGTVVTSNRVEQQAAEPRQYLTLQRLSQMSNIANNRI